MQRGKIVAIVIWLVTLSQFFLTYPSQQMGSSLPLEVDPPTAIIFIPVVFFAVAGFFTPRYPFDVESLRLWVDRKYGADSYSKFIRQLKPMLLFGVSALLSGVLGLVRAFEEPTHAGAYAVSGFMLSGGLGFLSMRLILSRRGLLMEAQPSANTWTTRSFVPQLIKRIHATWLTALLAGAWTAFGMGTLERLRSQMSQSTHNNVFLGCSLFFFFIPVFLFVFGIQNIDHRLMHRFTKESLQQWGRCIGRGFCWMLGAALFGLAYGWAQSHL